MRRRQRGGRRRLRRGLPVRADLRQRRRRGHRGCVMTDVAPLDGCDSLCTPEVRPADRRHRAASQRDRCWSPAMTLLLRGQPHPNRLIVGTSDGKSCPAGADSTLGVFPVNADGTFGNRLLFDDDGGPRPLLADQRAAQRRRYMVRAQGSGTPAAALPAYTLDYRLEVDVNAGGRFNGGLVAQGDDLYVFQLAAANDVVLFTDDGAGACPGDTTLRLFSVVDGVRAEVAFDDDGGQGLCSHRSQPAGRQLRAGGGGLRQQRHPGLHPQRPDRRPPAPVCGNGNLEAGEV
ncbi:MAG: hypothetical protein R3F43_03445 [bacterium]